MAPKKKAKRAQMSVEKMRKIRRELQTIAYGDAARAIAKSERHGRHKKSIPKPPEVAPKNDPRSPEHLTVAVYRSAAPEDADMPVDLKKWAKFCKTYGITKARQEEIRRVVVSGFPATITHARRWYTVYAVLEEGRARDDIARAGAALLQQYRALH